MSCDCFDECVDALGRSSVHHKICFERIGARNATHSTLSDMPTNLAEVRFFARKRMRLHVRAIGWVEVPLQDAMAAASRWPWRAVRQVEPRKYRLLPNSRCPLECSHRGTCHGRASGPTCRCHAGFVGDGCEQENASACINSCAQHGRCLNRFCLCEPGWFGVDCSLTLSNGTRRGSARRFAPTFVYPLPSEFSWQFLYQNDPTPRGLFSAGRVFAELLHARRDAIVADPEDAALFFVPLMPVHIGSNLWDPRHYFTWTVRYISRKYPYWNRTNGADHFFFTTQVCVSRE